MDDLVLPPDLERFTAEAVASGRYRDAAEVVRAGLTLLQGAEAEMAAFVGSLEAARREADRDGWVGEAELLAELSQVVRSGRDGAA